MGVQKRNVPHFEGLICAKVDLEAQGYESTSTVSYAPLKKPFYTIKGQVAGLV